MRDGSGASQATAPPAVGTDTAARSPAHAADGRHGGRLTEVVGSKAGEFRRGREGSRPGRRLALAAVFVIASMFYAWTAATAGDRAQFLGLPSDYYAQLADGFLKGELSIPTTPPKALVELPDPYNPVANASFRLEFQDLALYHGHFYVNWGPTPVLTLYLWWHLLHLGTLSGNLATWLYSVIGLAFALGTLSVAVDDFLPSSRTRWVVMVALVLAFCSTVSFIDREPDVYEVSVACGYCFAMLGLYLLATGGMKGRWRPWRVAGASLSFGLAAASRQDLMLLGLLLVPLALVVARRRGWSHLARLAAVVFGPFVLVMVALSAYNFARFGSPTQIGSAYQLAGFDPRTTPYYQLSYLKPSLYYYLISPVQWSLNFPFALMPLPFPPMAVPATYLPQPMVGVLSVSPILAMLVLAPVVLRRRLGRELRVALSCVVAVALAILVLIALSIPGGSERYVVDFDTLLLLPAGLCWLAWSPRRRAGRVAVRLAGTVIIVYGILVCSTISLMGYFSQIQWTQPHLFQKLVSATSPVGPAITRLLGHPVLASFGENAGVVARVQWDSFGVGTVVYLNIDGDPTVLNTIAPRRGTWTLTMSVGPGPQYADAGTSPILLEVRDATGLHRYRYVNGTYAIPVTLDAGRNVVTISEHVRHKKLPNSDKVLSASGLILAGTYHPAP